MEKLAGDVVADTSVVVKFFVEEPESEKAGALLRLFLGEGEGRRLVVPDFLFVEFANAMWKKVQRKELSEEEAGEKVSHLLLLSSFLRIISTRELLQAIFQTACTLKHPAYDAAFLAVAAELNLPLVTADPKLAAKARGLQLQVRMLREL